MASNNPQGPAGPQQTPLHPTVSYGQPGGQQATVLPPQGYAPQGYQPAPVQHQGYGAPTQYSPQNIPPAPVQQQAPQGGVYQPQPPQPQAPQGYAPQGYGQPQQPQPPQGFQIDPNTILDGPGVPPELRGRRWGQIASTYQTLAQDFINRQNFQRSAGALASPAGGQQQPRQGGGEPQGQQTGQQTQQQGRQQPQDWRQEIRQIVGEVISPVMQRTQAQAMTDAAEQARRSIPDFNDLEADIVQTLQGAPPESLANPAVWQSAADLARGRRARMGYQQQPGVPSPNGQHVQQVPQVVQTQYGPVAIPANRAPTPQVQYPGGYAPMGAYPQSVPAQQAPIPQYQFFSEGPTPPTMHSVSNLLTPQERDYARKMGMSDQDYMAWRGGVVR